MVAVASSGTAVVTLPEETQILITREFDAPKHLVYRAYTEPDLISQWWSGERGKVTSVEVDLRVGGAWRYVMMANEGFEVAFHGEYREIVPDEKLVFAWGATDGWPDLDIDRLDNSPQVTVTFDKADGRTELTLHVELPVSRSEDLHGWWSHAQDGWRDTVDRLAAGLDRASIRS
jgi:uncharacterized protein YndB with AHSA1/START domain